MRQPGNEVKKDSAIRVQLNPFSSQVRPALSGGLGAVAAAHPLAVSAGLQILSEGGSAVDAAIAAQAVIGVVMPEAAGVGGDGFFLVGEPGGLVTAVNGAGRTAAAVPDPMQGTSVTVPGLVAAWGDLSSRWGRLPLVQALQPAIRAARHGIRVDTGLAQAVEAQRKRLLAGGASDWALLKLKEGEHWEQPELAAILDQIAKDGSAYFYRGSLPAHICTALLKAGQSLDPQDFATHRSWIGKPLRLEWRGLKVDVQPPVSQGVLMLMALKGLDRLQLDSPGGVDAELRDHALVELVGSVFLERHRVSEGEGLLNLQHAIDLDKATNRVSARSYLHTAGVCCADRHGMTVASLMSVFDDFGSGVYVPEGGFVLNNRGDGFTQAPNDYAPGKAPVHTLSPIMITEAEGCIGMATPGADGQVQTLLQVLCSCVEDGLDLAAAIHEPRWRSEDGKLLIEPRHRWLRSLEARGHVLQHMRAGDMRAGSVMAAGHRGGAAFAVADWRRHGWAGAV